MSDVFPLDGRWMDEDERWLLCVDAGGTVWLARSGAPPDAISGDASRAVHEQVGPLPIGWQTAVDRVIGGLPALPPRCGRPKRHGGHDPCRARVAEPGQPCRWHQTGQ